MSFFPALLKLQDKKILLVGGGNVALQKLRQLLKFTTNITIISPKINKEILLLIDKYNLNYINREYRSGDINNHFIVVVAVDSLEIQKMIYNEATKKGVLCNSVDSIEYCDFIFPSIIKRDDLIIAISTSGSSPSISKYLKQKIEKILPKSITQKLQELKNIRYTKPKGKERQKLLDKIAKEYIDKNITL